MNSFHKAAARNERLADLAKPQLVFQLTCHTANNPPGGSRQRQRQSAAALIMLPSCELITPASRDMGGVVRTIEHVSLQPYKGESIIT
jgi:hypothetical protein